MGEPQDAAVAVTRTYGALATRLHEALGHVRQALAPHAEHLPGGTLAGLDALVAEFERHRVRVALYGEVKAGKSTLLNAIAGATLSPVAFDPLTALPVRITYGSTTAWHVGNRSLDSVAALERFMREELGEPTALHADEPAAHEVVVETNLELLQLGGQVDLLDTPGVGSEEQFDAVTAEALRSLDAVVLVVRYPALFTQFTRRLMESLETDIGKLFVVWNLDAACTDLTPEERAHHAEALRTKVAGAHELFLVDARAGFQAAGADDAAAAATSGLVTFTDALRRFASSGGRNIAALREAAKRAHQWLTDAERSLTQRHAALDRTLADARARLRATQAAADVESAAARQRLAAFADQVTRIGQQSDKKSRTLAAHLRRQLRTARRRWISSGDINALEAAIASTISRHADAVEVASRTTLEALQSAAVDFGSEAPSTPRARIEPDRGPLAPEERSQRAATGRWQLLRRTLWHRWYLPGLGTFAHTGIAADLAAQAAWSEGASSATRTAAQATLATRLAEITQRAAAEQQRIKDETHFSAAEAEFGQLSAHLPVVTSERERVVGIASEARSLFDTE